MTHGVFGIGEHSLQQIIPEEISNNNNNKRQPTYFIDTLSKDDALLLCKMVSRRKLPPITICIVV